MHGDLQRSVLDAIGEAQAMAALQQEDYRIDIAALIQSAALENAKIAQHAASSNNEAVVEQYHTTRQEIATHLEHSQETLTEDVANLQESLQSLHIEIERRTDELKELILSTSRTKKESKRKALQKRGESVTVIIMSLRAFSAELQVSTINLAVPIRTDLQRSEAPQ